MNTHNQSKVLVVILVIVTVYAAFGFAPRFFTEQKLKSQVVAQLMRSVPPTRTWQGGTERLLQVVVTDCQRSLKGDKYALKFELVYTGTLRTGSGCVLERDEWGHYTGQWNPPDFQPVRFFIQ